MEVKVKYATRIAYRTYASKRLVRGADARFYKIRGRVRAEINTLGSIEFSQEEFDQLIDEAIAFRSKQGG